MKINCGTCNYSYPRYWGEGFSVGGCLKDSEVCLTKSEADTRQMLRAVYGMQYDYRLWLPKGETEESAAVIPAIPKAFIGEQLQIAGARYNALVKKGTTDAVEILRNRYPKEKPICFHCPPTLWCGDCKDALKCMEVDQCGTCEFETECNENDEAVNGGRDLTQPAHTHGDDGVMTFKPAPPLLLTFEESQPTKAFIEAEVDQSVPFCAEDCVLREQDKFACENDCLPQQLKTIEEAEQTFRDTIAKEEEDNPHMLNGHVFAPSEAYLNDIEDSHDDHQEALTVDDLKPEGRPAGSVSGRNYDAIGALEEREPDAGAGFDLGPEEAADLPPNELLAGEDVVLHPNHYAEADIPSGIECWDWYELAMTEAEVTGHFKGNALKYIFRAGKKGNAIEDLEKARNYLARWIGYLNGNRTVHMRGKKHDG